MNANKLIKIQFNILKKYENFIRNIFVAARIYKVSGVCNGTLYLFIDKNYIFIQKNGKYDVSNYGEWTEMNGEIKLFDHWLASDDEGKTFWSYKTKLELISEKWKFRKANLKPIANIKSAFQAIRFDSRETDFLEWLPKGGKVAELGVETGLYAKKIIQINKPSELHLVDVWDSIPEPWPSLKEQIANYSKILKDFSSEIERGEVRVHKGDDLAYMRTFPDHYFDWVYIDTSHSYEQTLRELEICDNKVKSNGYICGHDYVDNEFGRNSGFGVIQAVDHFTRNSNWRITRLTNETEATFILEKIV
jgi:hypothetical protein